MLNKKSQQGSSLIETMISIVIVSVGLGAVSSLLVVCMNQEQFSRELAVANSLTRSKMEEISRSAKAVGGSLTSDVTNFSDAPTQNYVRRWQVSTDSIGTQSVTVVMLPVRTDASLPEVRLTTRMR